jgi:hypothetical protein
MSTPGVAYASRLLPDTTSGPGHARGLLAVPITAGEARAMMLPDVRAGEQRGAWPGIAAGSGAGRAIALSGRCDGRFPPQQLGDHAVQGALEVGLPR